jgi:hypothetical protein
MLPIPSFPQFRALAATDRSAIEAFSGRFPPYSDFGFTSLYAWDTDQSCAIAMLGDNLVLRLKDYAADGHFLTFLGQDRVIEAVRTLLDYAQREGLPAELRLVPEAVIQVDSRLPDHFAISEDRDNFDYIHAVEEWARFPNPWYREHRRRLARCQEQSLECRSLDLGSPRCQDAVLGLFDRWREQKPALPGEDREHERSALRRVFDLAADSRLAACGLVDGEQLVGFSIWERLPDGDYGVAHFQKADRNYRGLSSWQANELGRRLLAAGCRLINYEQDLGISGLREFKRSLRPCQMLKKYVIAGQRGGAR